MENDHASHIAAILRELEQAGAELERLIHWRERSAPPWQVDYDSGWDLMWGDDEEDADGGFSVPS